MKRIFLLITAAFSSIANWACTACTEVGCADGPRITINGFVPAVEASLPVTVHACMDNACKDFEIEAVPGSDPQCKQAPAPCSVEGGSLLLNPPLGGGADKIAVSVRVTDSNGTVLLEKSQTMNIAESTPNGPSCEPTCYNGSAVFDASE
jgi:hypothetical protein